ncbi:DUF2798 domain-containing protein [Alkalihalobacillus hwajinpoensis]|uniref:DUF2798 domain-containing protein n=1 Tax=Guptibacillus hwajinpoensis TaxID=208199 RepID=UPI00188331E3|nr:DUF2798 domain-containing protein [Pseudalkalibacillus hwajinpoensis]MBF0707606.1 DUF2798 domain-containing protein [Pseudalkalibacillus hwajinpoensis]
MPETKKEGFYFGLMMCFGMVCVMTFYNLSTNGLLGEMTLIELLMSLLLGYIIALLFEIIVVGPIAKKITFRLPFNKSHKWKVILILSTCMVIGMVFFMSFYGLIMSYANIGSMDHSFLREYVSLFIKNVIVAFPLQILIMGPLVRWLFVKYVKTNKPMSAKAQ